MSPRAALSGSLQELPLTALLPLLAAKQRQGVVELSGASAGVVVLDEGALTLALADEGPTLQQVIVGSGIASADGWEHAFSASMRGDGIADALISGGADPELLEIVLREQTIGALFEFILPSDTDFVFLEGATHPLGSRFRFDSAEMLDAAADRVDGWKVIAETIPSTAMVMRLTPELTEPTITITAEDWRILARVDGHTTVADLIRALGMSAFTVCGVLHRLANAGCVEPLPT
jgi:hypothetical protein